MKTKYHLFVLFLFMSQNIYSQIQVPRLGDPQCVECGGVNGNHKTWCSYYRAAKPSSASKSNSLNLQQQIMLNIFSGMLNNAVNNNNKSGAQNLALEQRNEAMRQQQLAILLAKQKRQNDSIAQANHDKMMKDYKPLEGSADLSYKGLDDKPKMAPVHFNCKITSFHGKVLVVKSNGQQIDLSETQSADIVPGDWIATNENSWIKLHYAFENGGEDITIGSKSVLTIGINDDGTHSPTLMRGKMYAVNQLGTGQVYQEGGGIIDQATFEVDKLKEKIKNKIIRMNVRTPIAVCGIRGTEFTVNVDDFSNTEVNVMNGIVDLFGILKDNVITLTAGTKGIVKTSGEILGPLKIDEATNTDSWWKDKE
jgi:hypothetical protein